MRFSLFFLFYLAAACGNEETKTSDKERESIETRVIKTPFDPPACGQSPISVRIVNGDEAHQEIPMKICRLQSRNYEFKHLGPTYKG